MVEAAGDLAGDLDVSGLVLTDGDELGLVEEDVGRLEERVAEEAVGGEVFFAEPGAAWKREKMKPWLASLARSCALRLSPVPLALGPTVNESPVAGAPESVNDRPPNAIVAPDV